jgi:hypothetical protein
MTIVYCIGIFVASWVLQLGGIRSVRGDLENGAITPWLIAAMITPALGVLVLMAFYTPGTPLARRQSEASMAQTLRCLEGANARFVPFSFSFCSDSPSIC